MRSAAICGVILLILLAGCFGSPAPKQDDYTLSKQGDNVLSCDLQFPVESTGSNGLSDPSQDVLGWEEGIWYNESIAVDQSNGLDCNELASVIARVMARVEYIRDTEFMKTPSVKLISRDTFSSRQGSRNVSHAYRAFQNIKYEALFMVNESADVLSVRQRNRATSVAAFYAPTQNTVVFIVDSTTPRVHSSLLAHEFVHALQDQHFAPVDSSTGLEDLTNAHEGLTEGAAGFVEYLYKRQCHNEWNGTCLFPDEQDERNRNNEREQPDSNSALPNIGMYLITYQPYSDGPRFIQEIYQNRGWAGVNALYQDPPVSTEQTIHPHLYDTDQPRSIELVDTSTDAWERITIPDHPDYERWGEAALCSMFMYPYYDSNGNVTIVPPESFFNRTGRQGPSIDPYNYSCVGSTGWDGDKLIAYTNDDGEYAYAWGFAFDSKQDARQFIDSYHRLLQYHDAKRVNGRQHVWKIPENEPFTDAFFVIRTENTVLIVNAPTVDELSAVRPGIGSVSPPSQSSTDAVGSSTFSTADWS